MMDEDNSDMLTIDLDIYHSDWLIGVNLRGQDLNEFDDELIFYYDETNNIGKLTLSDNGLNAKNAIMRNFILGGIAIDERKGSPDIEKLFSQLNLQNNTELKSSNICRSQGFLDLIESKRISIFLNWLDNNPLYVHYLCINNLYFVLVDIIDSLLLTYPDDFFYGWFCEDDAQKWILDIKEEFYKHAKNNLKILIELLNRNNYPDISEINVNNFCLDMINFLKLEKSDRLEVKFLISELKKASKDRELFFLNKRLPGILIEHYAYNYLHRVAIFKNSSHVFDREMTVVNRFQTMNILEGGQKCNRFKFIDSKTNKYIQISDLFVGLMDRYFTFINENGSTLKRLNLTPKQKENIRLLNHIIDRSDAKNRALIESINPRSEVMRRGLFLQHIGK